MTLPLLAVIAGNRGGRRVVGAALLLALVWAAPLKTAAAQDDDPFSATVKIDATSDSVAKARELARIDGQRRALAAVVDRLAGGPGKAKLPKLSDNAITDLVASFEVADEKMSAVRYMADYTFHFRPADLRKVLQNAGIAIADPNAPGDSGAVAGAERKPIVVLPVYQAGTRALLWDDPNPWREAWSQRPAGPEPSRLLVPLGDLSDIAAIDADKARSGDSSALAALARKNGVDEALVLLAVARTAGDRPIGLDVTARRYRLGVFVDAHSDSLDAKPGEDQGDFFRRAVEVIATDIDSGWKNAKQPRNDEQGSLTAVVPITGLDDWVKLRDRLSALPSIRKVELKLLSRQEATVEIQYVGDLDQLKSSLGQINLELVRGDPLWRIARSGADRP